MSTAIRFYSKFGHSKRMAEAIEDLVGAKAATVDTPVAEPVDTLYLGAGVFLGKVNGAVLDFIATLTPDKVGRVVCFGSSAIIASPVPQMRKALEARGIKVSDAEFSCKGSMGPVYSGHPDEGDIEDFRQFVRDTL